MKTNRQFPAIAKQISIACLIATLFVFFTVLNSAPKVIYPLGIIIYSVVIYFADCLAAKKERTVTFYIVLNIICAAIAALAFIFAGSFDVTWQMIFGILSVIVVTALGVASVFGSLKLNTLILAFDGNILMLIFSVMVLASLSQSKAWLLLAIGGAVFGLLGLLSFRLDRKIGSREWGILLVLFLAIAIIAWLLFSFVVSPLSTGVTGIGYGIAAAFQFIGRQIGIFFQWIASLLGDGGPVDPMLLEPQATAAGEQEELVATDLGVFPVIVIGIIIAALIVIAILVIKKTRKSKVRVKAAGIKTAAVSTQNTPFKAALKRALDKIKRWIRTKKWSAANKEKPEGIYFRLKKICKHSPLAEQPGDTPKEFLLRIGAAFETERSDITKLISLLNYNLYSGKQTTETCPWAEQLLSDTKKCIHKLRAEKEDQPSI